MSTILILLTRARFSYRYFLILTLSVLKPFCLTAQHGADPPPPKVVGRFLYEKLVKTQKEYEQAVLKGDSLEVAEMCYRLGKRYIALGDFEVAQKHFIRSLRIREREPYPPTEAIGKVYLSIANYQADQKKYGEAIQTVRKAMANFNMASSQHSLMSGYLLLAGIHALGYQLHQDSPGIYPGYSLDSALYYFGQAEKLALLLKVPYDIANVSFSKGVFLLEVSSRRGLDYLKKADSIFSRGSDPYPIINTSLAIGNAFLTLHQPAEARTWLTRARHLMDTSSFGDYKQQGQFFKAYTRLDEQTGNWKGALRNQKNYYDLMVEALSADRKGAITRLSVEYETEKKEAQLEWQRRLSQIVIGLCCIAVIASVVFYRFFQRYKLLSQQNADLVMEQNHRVKNNFQEVINMLTLQSNRLTNEDAQQAITEGLLRMEAMALIHQRLHYKDERLVEVNLQSFIPELVQGVLRSYNYAHVKSVYNLDRTLLHVDQAVPLGLIINELVTNSCKYAFPVHADPLLEVTCQRIHNMVRVEIRDNGPGFDAKKGSQTFGLKLIEAFTQRLNGEVHRIAGGKIFRLSFPIYIAHPSH